MKTTLTVNGEDHSLDADTRTSLLDALRKQGVRVRRLNGWRALNG